MKNYNLTTDNVSTTLNILPASVPNLDADEETIRSDYDSLFIPHTIETVCPTGGGLNGHRDPETNKLMGQTIRPGYWTAFGSAIWLQCKREEDENTVGPLYLRMREKALTVLRILAEADEEPTPLNKFKKKGFFRSLFSV